MVPRLAKRAKNLKLRRKYNYQRNRYSSGKPTITTPSRVFSGLLFLAAMLVFTNLVFGDGGLRHGNALDQELQQTYQLNKTLKTQLDRASQQVELLSNDPRAVERIARERYGMTAPGDLIYRFEDDNYIPAVPPEVPENQKK